MQTRPDSPEVDAFLAGVTPEARRADAIRLREIFEQVTGYEPVLWRPGIVGFGRYDYTYDSGRSGSYLATGFAPRKANMVLYILPGYADYGDLLARLGPHRRGKSCLYFTRLDRLDEAALRELIRDGLADLGRRWPVHPR